MAGTVHPDVFILDITMPNMNGIETARELRKRSPAAKIIMLSLHGTKRMVEEALADGAQGYLTKEMATHNVVEAVIEVHAGRYYLCPLIAQFVVQVGLMVKRSRGSAEPPCCAHRAGEESAAARRRRPQQ